MRPQTCFSVESFPLNSWPGPAAASSAALRSPHTPPPCCPSGSPRTIPGPPSGPGQWTPSGLSSGSSLPESLPSPPPGSSGNLFSHDTHLPTHTSYFSGISHPVKVTCEHVCLSYQTLSSLSTGALFDSCFYPQGLAQDSF